MLRIRGRTLRDESLETNTARDLEQVVRMFVSNGRRPCEPEFNYMIREKAVRNESLDRSNARDLEQVVRLLREVDVVSAFSNSNT